MPSLSTKRMGAGWERASAWLDGRVVEAPLVRSLLAAYSLDLVTHN